VGGIHRRRLRAVQSRPVGLVAGTLGVGLAYAASRVFDYVSARHLPDFPYKPESYFAFDLELIGYWRLRDWLRLLSFEVESGQFGCYRPPFGSERSLSHFGWMETMGERWWPVLGAVYFAVAVKRVRGMRLIGMPKAVRKKAGAAVAVAANKQRVDDEVDVL
jgi:hypothetical protein